MGEYIKTNDLVQSVVNLHDSILESQYARFLQQSPTYTTYFHINSNESTVDVGYMNTERPVGDNSSIRYNKINSFPIYGLEEAAFSLDEDQEGLDMNFHSSGIIIPNTINPLPGDFFATETLGKSFIFQITNVRPDTVRSNPFTLIEYKLSSIDRDDTGTFNQLVEQTVDEYDTDITNIGTDEHVLINSSANKYKERIEVIKNDITEYYKMIFYNSRYNSFLFPNEYQEKLYDKTLSKFISDNKVFHKKNSYDTLFLTIEDNTRTSQMEYHNSIFRAIEKRDPLFIKHNKFLKNFISDGTSIFVRWGDESIRSIEQGRGNGQYYISPEILDFFINARDYFKDDESKDVDDNGMGQHIIIPDENDRPVYVPDADITKKFTETTTVEQAFKMPRGDCGCDNKEDDDDLVTEDGKLNFSTIFGAPSDKVLNEPDEEKIEEVVDSVENIKPSEINHTHVKFELEQPEMVIINSRPIVEDIKDAISVVVKASSPTYLEPRNIEKFNVMIKTIALYFSGKQVSYKDLDLDALEDYLNYMDLYDMNTFILAPVLLFVLDNIVTL